jgi:hypothetical protein
VFRQNCVLDDVAGADQLPDSATVRQCGVRSTNHAFCHTDDVAGADRLRDSAGFGGRAVDVSTPENSLHSRAVFRRQLYAVQAARNGGSQQSVRRG